MSGNGRLDGLRVLIVEDEALILMAEEDIVQELGCALFGSTARLSEALSMVRDELPDVAVLDINLGDEKSYPLAKYLLARGVPVVFATGDKSVAGPWHDVPICRKPFNKSSFAAAILAALETPLHQNG